MARQKLGQHFLNSAVWQKRILEKLPDAPGDVWIEIGAGRGQMTQHLALRGGRVVAIEADARLAENLRSRIAKGALAENLRARIAGPSGQLEPTSTADSRGNSRGDWPNVEIAEGDVLSQDLGALTRGEKFRVYGSLPYYITSPILHHLFRWADRIASIHIVIQLEVAERIAARPGTRDYGYLSVASQFYASAEIALKIPPGAFSPPPKVHSALVAITPPGARATLGVADECAFLRFVQSCFSQKRKTLRNNILTLAPDKVVRQALEDANIPENTRAEQLSVTEFATLHSKLRQFV